MIIVALQNDDENLQHHQPGDVVLTVLQLLKWLQIKPGKLINVPRGPIPRTVVMLGQLLHWQLWVLPHCCAKINVFVTRKWIAGNLKNWSLNIFYSLNWLPLYILNVSISNEGHLVFWSVFSISIDQYSWCKSVSNLFQPG